MYVCRCFALIPNASASEVSDDNLIGTFASNYITSCSASISSSGSGNVKVSYTVTGNTTLDKIGASKIVLKSSSDGSTWTTVKTFNSSSYSSMLGSNRMSYTSYVSYSGTAGKYYKAVVTAYGEKNGLSDSKSITTASKKAT